MTIEMGRQRQLLGIVLVAAFACWIVRSAASEDSRKPVLQFQQFPVGPYAQGYSLAVRRDGQVTYVGTERVKTKGERQFQIPKAQVDRLLQDLRRLRVFEMETLIPNPPNPGLADRGDWLVELTVHDGAAKKNVKFHSSKVDGSGLLAISEAIESAIPTRGLRCPYYVGPAPVPPSESHPGREVCRYMDDWLKAGK